MRIFGFSVVILLGIYGLLWNVDMFILHPIRIFPNDQKYDLLELLTLPIFPFVLSLNYCQSIQYDNYPTDFRIFTNPYHTLLHSPLGEFINSSDTLALPFKTTVWWFHTLLILVFHQNFLTSIPYTIQYLLQS